MISRAAPGAQLAQGRLRVDAARAIAKLREYQLVDRTTWVLEAVRAAVASGATHLEVAGDANDVWVSWRGDAWPAEQLPRLFDELVSPEPAEAHHHLRLLATAINTALGLEPAFVDVITIPADGPAERVRYTPDVLETPASADAAVDDSALRRLALERVPRDHQLPPGPGMQVHYRRRLGLDVLKMFARLAWIPELRHVGAACRSVPVPLVLGASTFSRDDLGSDLVRVPLGAPLGGFLAVVDPATLPARGHAPVLEVAERGVVLARVPIDLGIGIGQASVPIRVFLDAPRLPTNASRSEVRRDTHPLPLAEQRARERVPALMAALRAALDVDVIPRARRDAVIALLAAACPDHEELHAHAGTLGGIGEVALVFDACGVRRPITQRWRALVHTGRSAMPPELAPWLSDVLWSPDDEGARRLVMGPIERRAFRQHVRWARRQAIAKDWFYNHAPREPRVAHGTWRVRARLGVPIDHSAIADAVFAGVTGEVCLLDAEPSRGEIVVLLEGRELDRIRISASVGFAAIVDDPRVTPGERYRSAADDDALVRVRDAVRGGIVRAAEALALELAGYLPPHGYETAGVDPVRDAEIVRAVIASAAIVPDLSPLAIAPVWPARDGTPVTLAAIRAAPVVAIAPAGVHVPAGRLVVDASVGADLLARLCPATHVIDFDVAATLLALVVQRPTAHVTAGDLALQLLGTCDHVLALPDEAPDLRAAIGIGAGESVLGHAGIPLHRWHHAATLVPSVLAIDSDDAIPTRQWTAIVDDAGVTRRDHAPWERQLASALARALIGELSGDLLGPPLTLESPSGRALLGALVAAGPAELLGAELARTLLEQPLLPLHGESQLRSIDELHALFPWGVNYVPDGLEPVAGYTPLVASEPVATAVAALVGRACVDGVDELARRAREQVRATRLAALRARPVEAVELPYETPSVALMSPHTRGTVGVAAGELELHVFVEGRRFEVVRRVDALPLVAAVDISADRASETLEGLAAATVESLLAELRDAVPALVKRVVKTAPQLLGDPSRARTLLARWCAGAGPNQKLRGRLRAVACFRTIHGGRASVKTATGADDTLSVASWHGDWLGPDGDADADPILDGAVLLVDDPEVQQIVSELAQGALQDVTERATKLQAQRQMARGLLPVPKLPAPAPVVRTFRELGELALGFGEIGLVDEDRSTVFLHARGVLRETVHVAIVPSIHAAVEAPELLANEGVASLSELAMMDHPVRRIVPQLSALTEQLLRDATRSPLPAPLVRRLRLAVLSRQLDGARVPEAALFTLVDGTATNWAAFEAQRTRFGDVWVVPAATAQRPADEHRRVFVLPRDEIATALAAKLPVVEAQRELALDEKARANRARPKATSLVIEPARDFLAIVKLTGDGVTSPRGYVAALAPEAAQRRLMRPHRELHPFDAVADPCEWPTYTHLDDARLVPDRLWQAPENGEVWREVLAAVRVASAQALRDAIAIPANALACERLTSLSHDGLPSLKANLKARIRGALWISGPPRAAAPPPPIQIITSDGSTAFPFERGQGLTGTLYVHAPAGFHAGALEELCAGVHARLVRNLATNRALDAGVVKAHVAHAIAMRRLAPTDVRGLSLGTFAQAPLDPASWLHLVERAERGERVQTVRPGAPVVGLCVVVDDTQLARVLGDWLDRRVTAEPRAASAPAGKPASPSTSSPRNASPRNASPLEELATRLGNRLVGLDVPRATCRVVGRSAPILDYANGELQLAREHPQLVELATALRMQAPWATTALDVLAAHALTLLDVALAEVTEATELRALDALLADS